MATKNNIIKGKTQSGIEFKVSADLKDDSRLLIYSAIVQNTDDPMQVGTAVYKFLKFIFGTDDNVLNFMDKVAEVHGSCKNEYLVAELKDIFEALNVKN